MREAERFARCLRLVLKHEGGFVDHPADPGGATNQGVTQATYDAFRRSQALPKRSVRHITAQEVESIYRRSYWLAADCDDLAPGVDYMVFDLAVNSGVSRAKRFLQEAVGVKADGVIGPLTRAAIATTPPLAIVNRMSERREAFYKSLRTFPVFGKGWMRRLNEVTAQAREWAKC